MHSDSREDIRIPIIQVVLPDGSQRTVVPSRIIDYWPTKTARGLKEFHVRYDAGGGEVLTGVATMNEIELEFQDNEENYRKEDFGL